jgi:3-phenylpropionate/trans-cinnamate dioxygenase ferredoxin reductase component
VTAGVLVVGASHAGVQVAVSLRECGYDGPVTLVGAEAHLPYHRPALSKAYLAAPDGAAPAELRTPAFYAERRIDVVRAERVVRVGLSPSGPPGSGTALTDRGRALAFDRLALTVGARPRRLDVPGTDLDGVCYLRALDDAARLRSCLAAARDVVVVGGGFVGLEVAAVARSRGRNVTIVEAAQRLLSRSVAPVVSEFYRRAHARRGTEVRLGAAVAGFHGRHGRVTGVGLTDGSVLPADLVVVGVGVVPRTELAEQLGLACDGGIVVDGYARTSDTSVVAAGDCTVLPDPLTGRGPVRLESMPNAVSQARVAAATLAGRPRRYADVPWFWSDQYDLTLQIAGLADGHDQAVVRGDPDSERFSVLYYRGGDLLAVTAVNATADYMAVRRALAAGVPLPADRAAVADTPLKELLPGRAAPGRAVPASDHR